MKGFLCQEKSPKNDSYIALKTSRCALDIMYALSLLSSYPVLFKSYRVLTSIYLSLFLLYPVLTAYLPVLPTDPSLSLILSSFTNTRLSSTIILSSPHITFLSPTLFLTCQLITFPTLILSSLLFTCPISTLAPYLHFLPFIFSVILFLFAPLSCPVWFQSSVNLQAENHPH